MTPTPPNPAPTQPSEAHTSTPWAVYENHFKYHDGSDGTEYCIGTASVHAQLRAPFPVVTTAVSCDESGKGRTTVSIEKKDAYFIVKACNERDSLRAEAEKLRAENERLKDADAQLDEVCTALECSRAHDDWHPAHAATSLLKDYVEMREDRNFVRRQLAEAEGRERRLREACDLDQVWSLPSTLDKLCQAVRHLRDIHNCDGHGHEEFYHALAAGERIGPKLSAALSSAAAPTGRGEGGT